MNKNIKGLVDYTKKKTLLDRILNRSLSILFLIFSGKWMKTCFKIQHATFFLDISKSLIKFLLLTTTKCSSTKLSSGIEKNHFSLIFRLL